MDEYWDQYLIILKRSGFLVAYISDYPETFKQGEVGTSIKISELLGLNK